MDLNTTIIQSIEMYPMLYSCRYQVMDQLFITIGNGYEWKNGELIETSYSPYNTKWSKELDPNSQHLNKKLLLEWEEIVSTAVDRANDKITLPKILYPGSINYSKIAIFPNNITQSWKDGIIEFHERLLCDDALAVQNCEIVREITKYAIEKMK